VAQLVTSPYTPLVASSFTSMGDLAKVSPGSLRPVVAQRETLALKEPTLKAREASGLEVLGVGGTSRGTTSAD
jgi:hypothetical protein